MVDDTLQLYWTNPDKNDFSIESKILEMIDLAKKRIFLCSFLINSELIVDALLKKAYELRGHVYCLTAIDENFIKYVYDENLEPIYEKYNFKALQRLSGNDANTHSSIAIRGHKNAHAKFIIIDNDEAFITSANFTHSSFKESVEIGFHSKNQDIVSPLVQLFKDCYLKRHTDLQGFKNKSITNYSLYHYKDEIQLPDFKYFNNKLNLRERLIWTYDFHKKPMLNGFENCTIKNSILELIKSEKKNIDIFTYSIKNLENSEIFKILIDKIENEHLNVRILIFCDKKNRPYITDTVNHLSQLNKNNQNLEIRAFSKFHEKGVITTEGVVLSSANFDGNMGLNGNFETGIISKDIELKIQVQNFFNYYYNHRNSIKV